MSKWHHVIISKDPVSGFYTFRPQMVGDSRWSVHTVSDELVSAAEANPSIWSPILEAHFNAHTSP